MERFSVLDVVPDPDISDEDDESGGIPKIPTDGGEDSPEEVTWGEMLIGIDGPYFSAIDMVTGHKVSLAHNVSFSAQKLTYNVSFWGQNLC